MTYADLPHLDQIRLERVALHLSHLGPRAIAEALAEVADHGDLARLDAYHRLSPELMTSIGINEFPARMTLVPAARRVA